MRRSALDPSGWNRFEPWLAPLLGAGMTVLLLGGLESSRVSRSDGWIVLQTWSVATTAMLLLQAVARRSPRARRGLLAAGWLACLIWALLNRLHFELFGLGLEADAVSIAVNGLRYGEVRLPTRFWGALALGLPVLAAGSWWTAGLAAVGPSFLRLVVWVLLVLLTQMAAPPIHGGLGDGGLAGSGFGASAARLLPWIHELRPALDGPYVRDPEGRPLRITLEEMRAQLPALGAEGRARLSGARAERPRDIVMVVLESFRWDLVSPETTPFMATLDDACLSPEFHYATAANTVGGLFGLLHGLSLLHYPALTERLEKPLPLILLGELGYERRLFRSFGLAYERLGERFFGDTIDLDVGAVERNRVRSDAWLVEQLLAHRSSSLSFDLLVLYSTHWPYTYPPELERHLPVAPEDLQLFDALGDGDLQQWAEGLKNRQRNAAGYLDLLLERLATALRSEPEPPILVITGDHGEEFFERGRLGHTWAVNNEMVRVPLWICLPADRETHYRYADHRDVFPTLFDALGVSGVPLDFTAGKSLLRYDPERDFALTGVPRRRALFRMAVVGEGLKVQFLPFTAIQPVVVTTDEDAPVHDAPREKVLWLLERATEARQIGPWMPPDAGGRAAP